LGDLDSQLLPRHSAQHKHQHLVHLLHLSDSQLLIPHHLVLLLRSERLRSALHLHLHLVLHLHLHLVHHRLHLDNLQILHHLERQQQPLLLVKHQHLVNNHLPHLLELLLLHLDRHLVLLVHHQHHYLHLELLLVVYLVNKQIHNQLQHLEVLLGPQQPHPLLEHQHLVLRPLQAFSVLRQLQRLLARQHQLLGPQLQRLVLVQVHLDNQQHLHLEHQVHLDNQPQQPLEQEIHHGRSHKTQTAQPQ